MQDCIFCQIVDGKASSYKVYEDNLFLGFLDIYPKSKGHTLLIPKKHYQWVYDVEEFERYWKVALKVTKAIRKSQKPYFIQYLTFGLDVPHAHIHIIPYYKELSPTEAVTIKESFTKEQMNEIAEKIRKEI